MTAGQNGFRAQPAKIAHLDDYRPIREGMSVPFCVVGRRKLYRLIQVAVRYSRMPRLRRPRGMDTPPTLADGGVPPRKQIMSFREFASELNQNREDR